MTLRAKASLATLFADGKKPNGNDFQDLIDTLVAIPTAASFPCVVEVEGTSSATARPIGAVGRRLVEASATSQALSALGMGNVGTRLTEASATSQALEALALGSAPTIVGVQLLQVASTAAARNILAGAAGAAIVEAGTTASALEHLGLVSAPGTFGNRFLAASTTAAAEAMLPGLIDTAPTGAVIDYAGSTEPSGWLFCYGQAISRTTYSALFDVIGTIYGAGDGSTTFNVPDLRGRVVAGQDDMGGTSANRLTNQSGGVDGDVLGATGGAETHTLTEAQLASHSHSGTVGVGGAGTLWNGSADSNPTSIGNSGGGNAHNNVQPTIILNKIIKT